MAGVLHAALLLGALGAAARRRLDVTCVDDPDWHVGSSPHKDCGLLSVRGHLCAKKGWEYDEDGQLTKTLGYEACPFACGLCDAGEEDSTSWYATGKTKNDCDWIGKNPEARCGKKDQDTKVEAWHQSGALGATTGDSFRVGTRAPRPAPASRTSPTPWRPA